MPQTVFISYANQDSALRDRVCRAIGFLKHSDNAELSYDPLIGAGRKWHPELIGAINRCVVAVMLISEDFLASECIVNDEVPALLKRRDTEGILLVPLLLYDCAWQLAV